MWIGSSTPKIQRVSTQLGGQHVGSVASGKTRGVRKPDFGFIGGALGHTWAWMGEGVDYGREAGKLQPRAMIWGIQDARGCLAASCHLRSAGVIVSRGFVVLGLPRGRGISLGGLLEGTAVPFQNEFDMEIPMGEPCLMLSRLVEISMGQGVCRIWFGRSLITVKEKKIMVGHTCHFFAFVSPSIV